MTEHGTKTRVSHNVELKHHCAWLYAKSTRAWTLIHATNDKGVSCPKAPGNGMRKADEDDKQAECIYHVAPRRQELGRWPMPRTRKASCPKAPGMCKADHSKLHAPTSCATADSTASSSTASPPDPPAPAPGPAPAAPGAPTWKRRGCCPSSVLSGLHSASKAAWGRGELVRKCVRTALYEGCSSGWDAP